MNWFRHPYLWQELRAVFRPFYGGFLFIITLLMIVNHYIIPRLPEYTQKAFDSFYHLKNPLEMVLFINYETTFQIVFWIGLFEVSKLYVAAKEEGQLDLYLAKPISRLQYLFAKLFPMLVLVTGLSMLCMVMQYIMVETMVAPLALQPFLASQLIMIFFALLLLIVVNYIFLYLQEIYYAMLIAFVVWFVFMLPRALYMYRPDVIGHVEWFRNIIVYPANLIWFQDHVLLIASASIGVMILLMAVGIFVALHRLNNMDI